jgi:predicted nucleic acid-binding protein
VIVDASVVVKWFVAEKLHEDARELLTGDEPLFAPDIVAAEVANALWVKVGRGEIHDAVATRCIAAVSGRGEPELRPTTPLVSRAFQLALRLGHPVYDCVYIALAAQLDHPLVTADRRLVNAARQQAEADVRALGS